MPKRYGLKERVLLLERRIKRMEAAAIKHGETEFARGYELGVVYAQRVAMTGNHAT